MDNLRELLNHIGPNIPFMMAGVGGTTKFNTVRIVEISVILFFLWMGFSKMETKLDWINNDYLQHKATTQEKLEGITRVEKRLEKIEDIVFQPIGDRDIIRRR